MYSYIIRPWGSAIQSIHYTNSILPHFYFHVSFWCGGQKGYSFFLVNFFHNGAHDVTNHTSFCFSPPKQIKKNHSTASLCGVLVHASNVFFKLYSQLQFISMLCLQRVFLVYLVHACCKFLYRRGYNQSALIQSFVVASVHICILMNFYIVSYFFCWYVHLLFEYLSAILLWWCYFLILFLTVYFLILGLLFV